MSSGFGYLFCGRRNCSVKTFDGRSRAAPAAPPAGSESAAPRPRPAPPTARSRRPSARRASGGRRPTRGAKPACSTRLMSGRADSQRRRQPAHHRDQQRDAAGEQQHARSRAACSPASDTDAAACSQRRARQAPSVPARSRRPTRRPPAAPLRRQLTRDRARGWRRAPRAARFPSARSTARASSSWLTLTHAISSTTPTDASSSSSAGREVPTTASCAGSAASVRPACAVNDDVRRGGSAPAASMRRRITSRSALARATLTPGLQPGRRRASPGPAACSPRGAGNCAAGMNRSAPR